MVMVALFTKYYLGDKMKVAENVGYMFGCMKCVAEFVLVNTNL
jgi:hypothetical protein